MGTQAKLESGRTSGDVVCPQMSGIEEVFLSQVAQIRANLSCDFRKIIYYQPNAELTSDW
jgi:hypothetical protein